jgi:hypothetical protein
LFVDFDEQTIRGSMNGILEVLGFKAFFNGRNNPAFNIGLVALDEVLDPVSYYFIKTVLIEPHYLLMMALTL